MLKLFVKPFLHKLSDSITTPQKQLLSDLFSILCIFALLHVASLFSHVNTVQQSSPCKNDLYEQFKVHAFELHAFYDCKNLCSTGFMNYLHENYVHVLRTPQFM